MAFAILLCLEYLHWSTEVTLESLISFHKAQCYFASTVQITALMLFHGADGSTILNETSALVVLVTSGFIPVTFGFASITRFGRPNLHLITLSVITSALATAALLAFYHYDNQFGDFDDYYSSLEDDYYMPLGPCAIGGSFGQTLFPLCGSSLLDNNVISSTIITKWWVWAAWAICMAWMVLCLLYNIVRDKRPPEKVRSIFDSLTRHPSMKLLKKIAGKLKGRTLIFIITPTLCFGVCFSVQFYLIILFNRHHLVSQVWSFGQIIAVTVWLPSICEYCHDVLRKCYVTCVHSFEDWLSGVDSQNFKDWLHGVKGHLKPKYTPLVRAMRDIVQQKVNMTNDVQIGRSNHAVSSASDPEAIPLRSAVDSHGTGQEDRQSEIVIEDSVEPA